MALRTLDENEAPVLALWPRGAGRVVALTAEVDGEVHRASCARGAALRATLEAHGALGDGRRGAEGGGGGARASGRATMLRVTLDFAPGAPLPGALPTLVLLPGDGRAAGGAADALGGRGPAGGRVHAAGQRHVAPGGEAGHGGVLRAPPVALPYAPEFEPGSAKEGLELLRARGGGGRRRGAAVDGGPVRGGAGVGGRVALAPWLVALALAVLLAEVAVRRFLSAPRVRAARARPVKESVTSRPATTPRTEAVKTSGGGKPADPPGAPQDPPPEPPKPPPGMDSALEAARARARRRTGR